MNSLRGTFHKAQILSIIWYIKLPKIGFVKLCLHRCIKGNELIKNVVVEKDNDDKYYVSIAVECLDTKNNNKTRSDKKEVVGIDMSMRHFLVGSEGKKTNHPKYLLKKMRVNLRNTKENYQKTLKLSDTRWTCSNCNTLHDRDINASLNLKAYYYKEIKTKAGTA